MITSYRFVTVARVVCDEDELIGVKEEIREALELAGLDVERVDIVGENNEKTSNWIKLR